MADGITFFKSGQGTAGTSASDYLKDSFDDYTLPASANTGLTSSASTNPLSQFFQNDDLPKYQAKTLYIKDLILVEDRNTWVGNKPTYKIEWTEDCPGAFGYCYGNIRLRNGPNGKSIDISNIDNAIGITGVIRKVAWIINGSNQATGTADLVTDGVDTGSDASFGGMTLDNTQTGVNHFYPVLHSASNATKDIHDYRLQANEYATLNVCGVIVYYENASSNIDCFPGVTYVDKTKNVTTGGATLALPSITSPLGGKTVIYKDSSSTYQKSTIEAPYLQTIGQGSTGTNQITVTTGQGASFPIGSGLIGTIGSTQYIGSVISVSTDTLTVSPTLGFGFSGALYRAWQAGPTFAVSSTLMVLDKSLDLFELQSFQSPGSFIRPGINNYYYSDPEFSYRLWGKNLNPVYNDGYPAVQVQGATASFLQIEGRFAALEIERSGNGIFHATFLVNGQACFGINEGQTGILKSTIFTNSGPSYQSVVISAGTSMGNVGITKVNLYQMRRDPGVTLGQLAEFNTYINQAVRPTHNATLISMGSWNRTFADSLQLEGPWSRGTTTTQAGGVFYLGATSSCVARLGYYGTDFALVGTGLSGTCTLDGASISAVFGSIKSVATLGFHSVVYTNTGSSTVIASMDYLGPQTGAIKNIQKTAPRSELATIPKVWIQSDTPKQAKDGDIWAQDMLNSAAWIKLFGRWFRFSLNQTSDDPNAAIFVRSHGSSDTTVGNGVIDGEHFNYTSWQASATFPTPRTFSMSGDGSYKGTHIILDGAASGSQNAAAYFGVYNKTAFSTNSTRGTPTREGGQAYAFDLLWVITGATDNSSANGVTQVSKWDGAGWASGAAVATAVLQPSCFFYNNLISFCGGVNTSGSTVATQQTKNSSDTNGTGTDVPAIGRGRLGGGNPSSYGMVTEWADGTGTQASYKWTGSWSASFNNTTSLRAVSGNNMAFSGARGVVVNNGGSDGTNHSSMTEFYNGTSFSAQTASTNARLAGVSSVT